MKWRVPVLYEDKAVIAVNKPPGLAAVPVKGTAIPSALSLLGAERRVFVVHRIDRFTSGVLLFAKTGADREVLVTQFLEHTPVRQYLAVVRGYLAVAEPRPEGSAPHEETLVHYLRKDGMFQKVSAEGHEKAARAELRYSVEATLRGASLIRATLITGFQNQIRVQFAAMGHPVVGDRKYCRTEAKERRIDRVALHAAYLEFAHPRSGKVISIQCEPPADFQALIRALSPRRTTGSAARSNRKSPGC